MSGSPQPVLVVYVTRRGQTRRIVNHLARALESRGIGSEILDAAATEMDIHFEDYSGVVVCGPVYRERHPRALTAFVERYRDDLNAMPSAFLSVSMSQAGAEDRRVAEEKRVQAASDAQKIINRFLERTGWRPARTLAVAGSLLYRQYNFLIRFVMRRIVKQAGGDTDTSRDYEYTDWGKLDSFAAEFAGAVKATARR